MSIKFADMTELLWRQRRSAHGIWMSVITMTLLQLDYLVYSLDNYTNNTPTKNSLKAFEATFSHESRGGAKIR